MTTPAKLFIGDLNFKTTEETIRNLFETVGTVYAYIILMHFL